MGEKKRRQSAQRAGSPAYFTELLRRALRGLEAGDRAGAEAAFSEVLSAPTEDADVLHGAGLLALRLARPGEAEKLLRRAIERRPGDAGPRVALATAYRHLGRPGPATEELLHALQIDPRLAQAHANLGRLLLESGSIADAARSFERALAIRGDYPDALAGMGAALRLLGQYDLAVFNLERALAIDPAFHQAHATLAETRFSQAAIGDASRLMGLGLESISAALRLCPENPLYWAQYSDTIRFFSLRHPLEAATRELLARALEHPGVDVGNLVRPIASFASAHPSALELKRRLAPSGGFDGVDWAGAKWLVQDVLSEPLLLRLLEVVVLRSVFLERLIGFARRATLHELAARPEAEPSLALNIITAIAQQSFNTEYVHDETAAELAELERLREAILAARSAGKPAPLAWYAAYAAYRPLRTLEGADRVALDLEPTALGPLAQAQILEPLTELQLGAAIPALSSAASAMSSSVQSQYESNPYPRWLRIQANFAPGTLAQILRELFPRADLEGVPDAAARILVAGCGTGYNSIGTARRFAASTLLAVDLSLPSLAYAKRKTLELGIGNIEYRQGDILALGSIAERFDLVECSGVLHHLEDPLAGWRILCSVLRPRGLMRIGLYSEAARAHVPRARELIAAQGFQPTAEGIRRCRAAILERQDDPLLAKFAHSEDFFSLSGCRDLLFNVQEHRFTLPRIAAAIEGLGLAFIGFEFPDAGATAARYRAEFPDDAALTDLEKWHRFETAHPDSFARMYQFWVRKRD